MHHETHLRATVAAGPKPGRPARCGAPLSLPGDRRSQGYAPCTTTPFP
jgi:hypothetical protein